MCAIKLISFQDQSRFLGYASQNRREPHYILKLRNKLGASNGIIVWRAVSLFACLKSSLTGLAAETIPSGEIVDFCDLNMILYIYPGLTTPSD